MIKHTQYVSWFGALIDGTALILCADAVKKILKLIKIII